MKTKLVLCITLFGLCQSGIAQETAEKKPAPVGTEADRKFLLDNLVHLKEEILTETKGLSEAQWNFKESPDRWSINQIVEHLCIWELIETNDVSVALRMGPIPDFTHYLPDSLFTFSSPEKMDKLVTTDYTKPFTYSVPLGNNKGVDNITWLTKMRDESIEFITNEKSNLRVYYICFGANIHQWYMGIFRHSFKHLYQIRQIKNHPNYPK